MGDVIFSSVLFVFGKMHIFFDFDDGLSADHKLHAEFQVFSMKSNARRSAVSDACPIDLDRTLHYRREEERMIKKKNEDEGFCENRDCKSKE